MRRIVTEPDKRARSRNTPQQPKRARQDGSPPITKRMRGLVEPAACERCLAVYKLKTWRPAGISRRVPADVHWTLCPACAQVEDLEYFGRVLVTEPLESAREAEVRRRIYNVERRARATQPERRMVQLGRTGARLEVLTTSQKLAHRIAKELEKAFGGRSHYEWTEGEGLLQATWSPEARRRTDTSRTSRHPHGAARSATALRRAARREPSRA